MKGGEVLIRLSIDDIERNASRRLPGYKEALQAAARPDPASPGHIYIPESVLRELWHAHTAPGLGDELDQLGGCWDG
jgi:hypothetical protein